MITTVFPQIMGKRYIFIQLHIQLSFTEYFIYQFLKYAAHNSAHLNLYECTFIYDPYIECRNCIALNEHELLHIHTEEQYHRHFLNEDQSSWPMQWKENKG